MIGISNSSPGATISADGIALTLASVASTVTLGICKMISRNMIMIPALIILNFIVFSLTLPFIPVLFVVKSN
jgi:hypothetical protein